MFTIFHCLSAYPQKTKITKINHKGFLIDCGSLLNYEGPGFIIQSFKTQKILHENIAHA